MNRCQKCSKEKCSPLTHFSLSELVAGWQADVDRLAVESKSLAITDWTWNANDFIGSLHLRDVISIKITKESPLAELTKSQLRQSDSLFRRITEEDRDGWIVKFAGVHGDVPRWWWRRIPRAGLPRIELNNWAAGRLP